MQRDYDHAMELLDNYFTGASRLKAPCLCRLGRVSEEHFEDCSVCNIISSHPTNLG